MVQYLPSTFSYQVQDADGDKEHEPRCHIVPVGRVLPLPIEDTRWVKYKIGQRVLAMYPSTTSFYYARVQVPNPISSVNVLVHFEDDADDSGRVPVRKVPYRYVTALHIEP